MPWKCEVCTLINADDSNKTCNLCGKAKGTPDPDAGDERLKHLSLKAILKAGPEAFNSEIQEVQRLKALKEIKGVFGVLLNSETPVVLCDSIAFLRAQGMYTEGLFRIPGNQDVVDALKFKYSEEKTEDVLNAVPCEVHDVGTLLKSYFRLLPQPVVPKSSYDMLLNACRTSYTSKAELENAVFGALARLQSPNKECLSLLLQFLREVAQFEKYNKMSAANLATCFAPSLLRAPDDVSPEQALMDMSAAIGVLVVLLRSERKLFVPSKETIRAATKHKPKSMVPPPPGLDKGGEPERRGSKTKTFSLSKTFSNALGRNSTPREPEPVGPPPGMGPPVVPKRDAPPQLPSRKKEEEPPARPVRANGGAKPPAKGSVAGSGVPTINIEDKI
jgi:hypothetical protein